jgi:hypothetical protein
MVPDEGFDAAAASTGVVVPPTGRAADPVGRDEDPTVGAAGDTAAVPVATPTVTPLLSLQ